MRTKLKIPKIKFKEFSGEWEEKKLGEVLTIGSGRDYKHLENGKYPVYGTGGYMLSVSDYLYDGESVCIGRKGTIDKPRFLTGKFWTVDTLFYTHSFINSLPKYVFYIFNTINWQEYNEASGVPSLSKSTLNNIKLNLPSLPEQQKISSFLSSVDEKIEKIKEKKKSLLEYKKGVMQKIFSQEIRFKSENGEEFEEWEEKKLGEVILFLSDYTANGSFAGLKDNVKYYNEENYAVLVRTTDLEKKHFIPQRFTDEKGYNFLKKTSLFGGELILANVGSIGKVYKVPFYNKPMTLAPNTYVIKLNSLVLQNFIFQIMLTSEFKNKLLSIVGSSTLKAINKDNLRSIKVNIPTLKEQEKIADFLSGIDEKIEKVSDELEKMEEFKKGLLQGMFV